MTSFCDDKFGFKDILCPCLIDIYDILFDEECIFLLLCFKS